MHGFCLLNPCSSQTSGRLRCRARLQDMLRAWQRPRFGNSGRGTSLQAFSSAVPDWGAVIAGATNTSMGGGGAPGIGSKQDPSIETLLAEFQAAPSISLGDFPTLDESFLRQTGTLALLMHSELGQCPCCAACAVDLTDRRLG